MMEIKIYQINIARDTDLVTFLDLETMKKSQKEPGVNSAIYDMVFEGKTTANSLEELYEIFNLHPPANFRGRSMSVSDVVEVKSGADVEAGFYFCDSIGFQKVDFQPKLTKDVFQHSIRVVLLEPGKLARAADLEATLEGMQKAVGGWIEAVYPFADQDVCLVVNEEGKLQGLDWNRAIYDGKEIVDVIAGPAFICDCSGPDFGSLPKEKLEKYIRQFYRPERFLRIGNQFLAQPFTPKGRDHER